MSRNRARRVGLIAVLAGLTVAAPAPAATVVRSGAGANPAAIQATVDQFRADLGVLNPNLAGSVGTGRREINWDGVPDSSAAPNQLSSNFFNVNSPRGVVLSSAAAAETFSVSADSSNPTTTPVEFGNIDPTYPGVFQPFSSQRLFLSIASTVTEIQFMVPGTSQPATVSGFGAVFSDVDSAVDSYVKAYSASGVLLSSVAAPVANNGLSFAGATYDAGERVARVQIVAGNAPLAGGSPDGGAADDKVVLDDFIYGEPSVPPQTIITARPPRKTATRRATFEFDSVPDSAEATFICKLDTEPSAPCTSPTTYRRLARKRHTFTVFATLGGLVDGSPASASWRVRRRR